MINLNGKVILIADDEPMIRQIIAANFGLLGATVMLAENGIKAFEQLLTKEVNLICSDLRMSGGDGVAFLKMVRENGFSMPFFFITGYSDFILEDVKSLGVNEIFPKPFDMQKLEIAIAKALNLEI